MKKIVLAILLACLTVAATQVSTQAQAAQNPPAGSGGEQNAPTVSGPEYNAYMGAIQQQDPTAKASALEAFLTQYPNSVMKASALEQLMSSYQAANNQAKVQDAAKRLLTADPTNLRALALQQHCLKGLEAVAGGKKPAGMKDEDYAQLKKGTGVIFNGGCGFAALQNKDFPNAQKYLRAAVEVEPNDLQNVYPLALAYLTPNPRPDEDALNGLFFMSRAVNLSNGNADLLKYLTKTYKNFHGSEEGLNDLLACAKANPLPTPDCTSKITKYVPPTPAQQAHDLVNGKTPDQIAQLSFGEWELVLSAGTPEDQDKVWSVIKGKPLQMVGDVIEVPSNTEIHVAASADDIDVKRADIQLTMSGPIPAAKMPKAGDTSFAFEGVPTSYTATPFMMQMNEGKLLRKPGSGPTPKKAPVRRRPAAKKPAQ
jgi:tetratricopeptide (TPR) repeat protein